MDAAEPAMITKKDNNINTGNKEEIVKDLKEVYNKILRKHLFL